MSDNREPDQKPTSPSALTPREAKLFVIQHRPNAFIIRISDRHGMIESGCPGYLVADGSQVLANTTRWQVSRDQAWQRAAAFLTHGPNHFAWTGPPPAETPRVAVETDTLEITYERAPNAPRGYPSAANTQRFAKG